MKTLLQYQLRQAELKKIMAESDSYASKCYKIGASFSEMYPEKFAEYMAANDEYNANEVEMQPLIEAFTAQHDAKINELKAQHKKESEARKAKLEAKKAARLAAQKATV